MTVDLLTLFASHKSHLFGVAYRMLGSVADAEDMVQEAYLRWQQADRTDIRSPEAWLTTVVTRLCLNHLQLARVKREEYVGPWLPEPLVGEYAVDPRETAERADSLSMAFLVILEALTPAERAVYLLREVFGYEFDEVARMIEKSEANCRQLLSRARQHVTERRARFKASAEQQQRLVAAFLAAANQGDLAGLMAVLTEDATFVADGGGLPGALRKPVVGSSAVAQVLLQGVRREQDAATVNRFTLVNGLPGIAAYRGTTPRAALAFAVEEGRIRAIYLVANPEKLRHFPALSALPPA